MTENDSAVYYGKKAWHGLGTVTNTILSPREALVEAGLDWTVKPSTYIEYFYRNDEGENVSGSTSDRVANVRSDTGDVLGWVGKEYKVVQNAELAELAYSLAGDDTHVESFGSLRNGARIYTLLRADSFMADGFNDTVDQYLCLCNGHDGTLALSGLPTSIRIVCENTLNMALSQSSRNMFRFTHNGDMADKMAQARQALSYFRETGKFFRENVQQLTSVNWDKDSITKFWLDCYQMIEEKDVNPNPQTEAEDNTYKHAMTTLNSWSQTFDSERSDLGSNPTPWMAANAVTNWLQHRKAKRGRQMATAARIDRNLFGKGASNSMKVMRKALAAI